MSTTTPSYPPVPAAPLRPWPGPRGHWLLGCLRQIQNDPLPFYHQTWRASGHYVRLRILAGVPMYLLAHPEAVDHVLHKNHKNYRKPDVFNRPVSRLAGNGILTSEGTFWRRQRRLVQPAFPRQQLTTL